MILQAWKNSLVRCNPLGLQLKLTLELQPQRVAQSDKMIASQNFFFERATSQASRPLTSRWS